MKEAIAFYTEILDFEMMPGDSVESTHVDLVKGDAQIQITTMEGIFGIAVNVEVDEVDELFDRYIKRGHTIPNDPNSPVHNGPLNQTWGTREFYITDPSDNTLRFRTWRKAEI